VPAFKDLRCPHSSARPCTLSGSNLFLVDSIAANQDFDNATEVPTGFTGAQLTVPHPVNGALYMKLRDDPEIVQTLMLPVTPVGPAPVAAESKPAEPKSDAKGTDPAVKADPKPESKTEPKPDAKVQ
jgi:hypothetical protein